MTQHTHKPGQDHPSKELHNNNPAKKPAQEKPTQEKNKQQSDPDSPEKKIQIDDNPEETQKKIPH